MAVEPISAGIGAGINVLASLFGSSEQAKQLKRARGTIQEKYGEAQEAILPWREAGAQTLQQLVEMTFAGPGEITEDPGYKFELEQGAKSLKRYYAARGQRGSGAFARRMSEFSQGLASTRYNDFLNRYRQRLSDFGRLSDTGYSAATQSAGLSTREGDVLADLQTGIGTARASGYAGVANALTGGLRDYYTYKHGQRGGI